MAFYVNIWMVAISALIYYTPADSLYISVLIIRREERGCLETKRFLTLKLIRKKVKWNDVHDVILS